MATVEHISRRRAGGRPPRTSATRLPVKADIIEPHRDYLDKLADELKVSRADYVGYVLAKAHGLEIPDYLQFVQDRIDGMPEDMQGVLPLALDA